MKVRDRLFGFPKNCNSPKTYFFFFNIPFEIAGFGEFQTKVRRKIWL